MSAVFVCAGKGGVGKTLASVILAIYCSRLGKKTAIIDFDAGHSTLRTLGISGDIDGNKIKEVAPNLSVVVIENMEYIAAQAWKEQAPIDGYFNQFPGDLGVKAYADILAQFFGAPTDIAGSEKFSLLVRIMHELRERGHETIVIDVEPTAGLQTLLSNAEQRLVSLERLKNTNKLLRMLVSNGWPDVIKFIEGPYIRNIETYGARIRNVVEQLRAAHYFLVATAEMGPVAQTFQVAKIIRDFGGKPELCVANNIRGGEDEADETEAIKAFESHCLPIVRVPRLPGLARLSGEERQTTILEGGVNLALKAVTLLR